MIKRCFLGLMLVLSVFAVSAQGFLEVSGMIEKDRLPLGDCNVSIIKNGSNTGSVKTSAGGKFQVKLDLNSDYVLEVSKTGFATKRFRFKTTIPAEEKSDKIFVFELMTDLFEVIPTVDYSALSNPLVVVEYFSDIKDFSFDMDKALDMDEKVLDIEYKILEIKKVEDKYKNEIVKADNLLATKQYEKAKLSYVKALKIKGDETYPKDRITEIDKLLAASGNMDAYNKVIAEADNFLKQKLYEKALSSYTKATTLNTTDVYPKNKIDEINTILANLGKQDEMYKAAIAEGDQFLASKEYEKSKNAYQKALSIKASQKYPTDKINEINALLAGIQNQRIAYDKLIADADKLFGQKQYQQSKSQYTKALEIFAAEKYPKDRIAEIDAMEKQFANQDELFKKSIAEADRLYSSKDLEKAKKEYQNALSIKADEKYPKDQIQKINAEQSKIAGDKIAYDNAVADGDAMLNAKKYDKAKESYNKALVLQPGAEYPQKKIAEIDNALSSEKDRLVKYDVAIKEADQLLLEKNYGKAKERYQSAIDLRPEQTYPVTKITEINNTLAMQQSKDQTYFKTIADADNAFNSKSYDKAREFYQSAVKIKGDEQYPKDRINEINAILLDLEKRQQLYAKSVMEGDKYLNVKDYENARKLYLEASNAKPEEKYPKDKIQEIAAIIAEQQGKEKSYVNAINEGDRLFTEASYVKAKEQFQIAVGLKNTETYPQQKIAEIDKIILKQKDDEAKYQNFISVADIAFKGAEYEKARQLYNQALAIKPDNPYPNNKINEINQAITDLQNKQLAYDQIIVGADKYFVEKSYAQAKTEYQKALGVKPSEKYPTDKLAEIAKIESDQALEQQKYLASIKDADNALATKNYNLALNSYQKASSIKPGEAYPLSKIEEVKQLIAQVEKQKNELLYTQFIKSADSAYNAKNYNKAREKYVAASVAKPGEQYPLTKVNEINDLLEKELEKEVAYKDAILRADKFFANKRYDLALKAYQEATNLKPTEQYPKDKIKESNNLLGLASIAVKADDRPEIELVTNAILVGKMEEKRVSFTPIARKSNATVTIKVKNSTGKKSVAYLYYGLNTSKSGGFVVNISEDSQVREYVVRLNEHVKWNTIANNWLGVYSDQGGLEVISIKIKQ